MREGERERKRWSEGVRWEKKRWGEGMREEEWEA